MIENEKLEFKQEFTDNIFKTIIAFANTKGGEIYIGKDDKGNDIGLKDLNKQYVDLTNGVKQAIAPDTSLIINYELLNDNIIKVSVEEGTNKPYYLVKKGLKPEGVYIRQGATSVMATTEKIKDLIVENSVLNFEDFPSNEQKLTFFYAEQYFNKHNLMWDENKFYELGIKNIKNNKYTNVGLLLSDECPYTIKVAIFNDDNNTVFQDNKEFKGSVLEQLENAYEYINMYNKSKIDINGDSLNRIEEYEYPRTAIREALVNSVIHRDYSFSGSIIVNMNQKQMEFISIGGLLERLSIEDIKLGISQQRNEKLSSVFKRLGVIESYGTGIRRIYDLYSENEIQPEIQVAKNTFKIILPKIKNKIDAKNNSEFDLNFNNSDEVIAYYKKHNGISIDKIMSMTGLKKSSAYNIKTKLNQLYGE